MLLEDFQLESINHWDHQVISMDEHVFDIVSINYSEKRINCVFKFKRYKSLCFYESFLDYGETYTSDIDFIELLFQLKGELPMIETNIEYGELEI